MSTWTLLEISCLVSFFYPFLRKFFESKRDKWSRGSLHSLCIKCRSLQKVVRFLWIKKQERIIDFEANVSQENRVLCHVIGIQYSEVPNRRADQNKQAGLEKNATLLVYLLIKSINEQGGKKI